MLMRGLSSGVERWWTLGPSRLPKVDMTTGTVGGSWRGTVRLRSRRLTIIREGRPVIRIGIGVSINTRVAEGSCTVRIGVNLGIAVAVCSLKLLFFAGLIVVSSRRLAVRAAAHTYITPYTDATALLLDGAAKVGALGEARKLLGTEHTESARFDL